MRFSVRLAILFLVFAATLAFATGIAVVMRNDLAAGIIVREFASRGANAELQVTKLSWNEIILQDLVVEELRIGRMQLTYSIRELAKGQIRTANIEGLAASIDLTGDTPPLGGLQRLFSEFGTPNQTNDAGPPSLPPLPNVTIEDAQVSVLLPEREIRIGAYGGLEPNNAGGEIGLSFEAESGPFLATGDLRVLLEGTNIALLAVETNLTDSARAVEFTLNTLSEPLDIDRPELQLRLTGAGDVSALAAYTALDNAQRLKSGTFQVNVEGIVALPLLSESLLGSAHGEMTFALALSELTLANPGNLPAWMLDRIDAELSGIFALQQAAISSALTAEMRYAEYETTFDFSAPEMRATLNEDYSLQSLDLNAFVAAGAAIATPYGTLGAIALEGSLSDLLSGASGSFQVHATAPELRLAAVSAREAVVDARASLSPSADGYRLFLDAPGQVSLAALSLPAMLPIEALSGQVLAANLELVAQEEGYSFRQSAQVRLPDLSLAVERGDASPLLVQIESGPIDIESTGTPAGPVRFTAATSVGALEIPELSLLTQNAEVNFSGITGGEINARLHGGTVSHAAENPFYTPLRPDLHMIQSGDHISFDGDLHGAGDLLTISVRGEHDLAIGGGNMRFLVEALSFGPGGATESSVSPLLASMENLGGLVDGEANFSWSERGVDTSGRLKLEQMSFRRSGMTIEGLATELTLDRLLPPRSLPSQILTIRRIDTGFTELDSLDLRFKLDTTEDGTPRVYADTLSMNIAGGRIVAQGGTIDPTTGESNIPLRAENLDLAQLLAHIGLEELTGEGQLNGMIPVSIGVNGASIEGATLQAGSSGIVAYRSERAREALASGGDAVNLMLDALEDFHYDSLGLTLSKPVAGDTEVRLRMEGHNPGVLEGHPFDINISLTGDADPLLEALLAGQQLSNDLLRSITGQ